MSTNHSVPFVIGSGTGGNSEQEASAEMAETWVGPRPRLWDMGGAI